MPFLICEKHHKTQRTGAKAVGNGRICMNKGCQRSLKVMCENCQNQHDGHANYILSIEDTSFLLDRLLKLPIREMIKPIGEALDIIKQLKLIKEFRKKIDILEKQLQKESLQLIDQTQSLIQEYATCKENATNLSNIFNNLEETNTYKLFFQNSSKLLNNFEYNFKKDKLEFVSATINEKEQQRSRILASAKEKIEEVRDYSMKIIEVILSNDDSDSDEQDAAHKRKHYEALKQQICLQSDQQQQLKRSLINDCSFDTCSNLSRFLQEKEIQTHNDLFTKQEIESKVQEKVEEIKLSHIRSQNDFKLKLHAVVREKENIHRQLSKWKEDFQEKKKIIAQLQVQLKQSKGNRLEKAKLKQDLMNKIIQIWNMKGLDSQSKLL